MYRHLLRLPDGRELFSGTGEEIVITSVTVTEAVNDSQELMPGSVCAACMEATLIAPAGGLTLLAGDKVELYRVGEDQQRLPVGSFRLEKPTRLTAHTLKLTGYDAVAELDRDLTGWLSGLSQWPYSVAEFARMVCSRCGVTLEESELPNADFFIAPFAAEEATGRRLMQWLGQVTGRFCRATPEGTLRFDWYKPNTQLRITPSEEAGSVWYYQNGLSYEDYQVAPVEKVQLRQNAEDVGTVYPDESGEKNTYILENNPMLAARDSTTLLSVAQTLYTQLQAVTYTPGRVQIPAIAAVSAGDILQVTDANGYSFSIYVMKKTSNGQTDTLECTGSPRRDSSAAVNNTGYRALSGKVLNLRTDVDGLKAENKDTAGRLAGVYLDLEGIRAQVQSQDAAAQNSAKQLSSLTQRADALSLELITIRDNGTRKVQTAAGYTFDDQGLRISRSDSLMDNTVDHTGMYVRRLGQTILQANDRGVEAADVSVRNYLVIGDSARLEDYGTGRTACFYIG